MLQLSRIEKKYGNFLALEIPDATIPDGLVWLQGENGSGKTTMLKIIAGLIPFRGDIILNKSISLKKQRQSFLKQVNYAEAEPIYPPFLTAEDLVKLYCHTKKGHINEIKILLEQFHLNEVYKNKVGTYSSGMLKKLSLALAFTGNPKLILLDEPFITIDAKAIEVICSVIKQWNIATGCSFIITSHQAMVSEALDFTATFITNDHTITKTS